MAREELLPMHLSIIEILDNSQQRFRFGCGTEGAGSTNTPLQTHRQEGSSVFILLGLPVVLAVASLSKAFLPQTLVVFRQPVKRILSVCKNACLHESIMDSCFLCLQRSHVKSSRRLQLFLALSTSVLGLGIYFQGLL